MIKTRLDEAEMEAFDLGFTHSAHGLEDKNPYTCKTMQALSEAYQQGNSWYRILNKAKKPSIDVKA